MTTPSLPAIRERARAWQEEQAVAAARDWRWTGPPEVPGLWEEVAFLLALVADLQERMQVTQAENRRVWDDTESLRGEVARLKTTALRLDTGCRAYTQGGTRCSLEKGHAGHHVTGTGGWFKHAGAPEQACR